MRNSTWIFFVVAGLGSGLVCIVVYATEVSLESFVRGSHSGSASLVSDANASKAVPNHSAASTKQVENEFGSLDDAQLKDKGEQKKKEPHNSDIMKTLERKPLDNFESHEMFKKADDIQQALDKDPAALLKTITSEDCIEQINEAKNHYTKHTAKKMVQDIEYEEKTCETPTSNIGCKQVLQVTCSDGSNTQCDAGGITGEIRQGEAQDVQFSYSPPTLVIGAIQRELWRGTCAQFDRAIKFNVESPQDITEFAITEIGYDDYIWIRVNDNTVYVGPDGGDRIERKTVQSWFGEITQVTNGHRTESCERGTDWSYTGYIDIKNHLKQGENTIWMRVIVSGSGEGWMKIKARQRCCTKLYLPTSRI